MNAIRNKEAQYADLVYRFISKHNHKLNQYEGFQFDGFVDLLDDSFGLSSEYEDTNLGFDFIYEIKDILTRTTGFRCRSHKYMHYNDVSIRSRTKKGNYCELDKILDGYGQYNVYAYENETKNEILKAYLIEMEAIRQLTRQSKFRTIDVYDGSFNVYSIEDIKLLGCLIDKYDRNN